MSRMHLKDRIDSYPDFPKKGILFRDFGPILRDPQALLLAVDEFVRHFNSRNIDVLAGIESRGFIVACALAAQMGKGMIMIRKKGKLPGKTRGASYATEYGRDTMEIQDSALEKGQRVLICDDLLATGGTARAAADLVEDAGARVAGFAIIIELADLAGIKQISKYNTKALVRY